MIEVVKIIPLEPRPQVKKRILDVVLSIIEENSLDYSRVLFLTINDEQAGKLYSTLGTSLLDVDVPTAKQYVTAILQTKAHKHHEFVKSNYNPRSYVFTMGEFAVFINAKPEVDKDEVQLHMYIKQAK